MTGQWHPREYQKGDERGILDLYKLVFGTEMSGEHWEWKYKGNPAGQALVILAESDKGIVGQYALLPRLMKIGDNVWIGSLSVDSMVHPDCSGQGIFTALGKKAYELASQRGIHFVYGFPNANIHHLRITRLGWTDLYDGIPLWVKPLNLENILRKRFVSNELLVSLGGKIGKIAMRVRYKAQRSTPMCSVKETSSFDPRFDSLWNQVSGDHEIVVVRDKAYLTWRYHEKPSHDYVILTAEEEHDLLGYVVLRCMEDFSLQMGFIVDILTTPKETRACTDLITAAVDYFELRKMDIVSCLMLPSAAYSRSLTEMGFMMAPKRLLPQRMYLGVCTFTSEYPAAFLAEPRNWFITWGDHDYI